MNARVGKFKPPLERAKWTQASCLQLSNDLGIIGRVHLAQPVYSPENDIFVPVDSGKHGAQRIREALNLFLKAGAGKLKVKHLVDLIPCYTEQLKEGVVDQNAITVNNRRNKGGCGAGVKAWYAMPVDQQTALRDEVVQVAIDGFMDARKEFRAAMKQKDGERGSGKVTGQGAENEEPSGAIALGPDDVQPQSDLESVVDETKSISSEKEPVKALALYERSEFFHKLESLRAGAKKKAGTLASKMSKETVVGVKQFDERNLTIPLMRSVRLFANAFADFQEPVFEKSKSEKVADIFHALTGKLKGIR